MARCSSVQGLLNGFLIPAAYCAFSVSDLLRRVSSLCTCPGLNDVLLALRVTEVMLCRSNLNGNDYRRYMYMAHPDIAAKWTAEEKEAKRRRKVSKSLAELGEIAKKLLKPAHIKALQTERGRGVLAALAGDTDDASKLAIKRGEYAQQRLDFDAAARKLAAERGEDIRANGPPRFKWASFPGKFETQIQRRNVARAMTEAQQPGPRRRATDSFMRRMALQEKPGITRYQYAREQLGRSKSELKYGRAGRRNRWEF